MLSLKIPRSAFFCSGNFSFSALLFHKLLFQGIKFSVFDTSVNKNLYEFRVVSGEGQNFERANVERPIFRNKKIASVERYEVQLFDFFIYEIIFSFVLNYLNAPIFYNFPNLIFF